MTISDHKAALSEFTYDINRIINLCEGIAYRIDVDGKKIEEAINHLVQADKLLRETLGG